MKKKKRATVETEKIEETSTAREKSKVSFRISQRTIISLIVAVCVAVISYAALWILAATVSSKSDRELRRHAEECAEYIAHIVNEHKAEDDIGRAVDEIKTMAYSLSARIVIVDTDYKVVVDSYGKDTGRYLVDENVFSVMKGQQKYISETSGNVYRRIIPVINSEGYTDAVMNAARAAGARGGTVIHGKGTGAENAQKFYNISIADEKEIVMIVASAEIKSEIMRSILEKAGPGSDAGALVFSIPVSEAAGFGFIEEE